MTKHSLFIIYLLAAFFIAGCSRYPQQIKRLQWCTMGTIAAVQSTDLASAQKLRTTAIDSFGKVEDELSAWNPESDLSTINNRAGSNTPTPVSAAFTNILKISTDFASLSDGAFNPLIGPVLNAWGFNGTTAPAAPPADADLSKALMLANTAEIRVTTSGNTPLVSLGLPGMQLDFGAVAKGYAVDIVWQKATKQGLSNLLIDLGGNLRAMGEAQPGRGGWLTGIKNPFNKNRLIAKVLLLDGEAISTSGNYERFVEIKGERCAHIIDGRTAKPVKGMAGVTVIAPDAATADALSTTLFITGVEKGEMLLEKHFTNSLALWIPDRQPAEIIATDRMKQRLQKISVPYR
ncbi:MAG: FAD:protein FMN transferase [Kiritimatiellia bacterium]